MSGGPPDDAETTRQHQIEAVGRIAGLVENPAARQAEPFELVLERQSHLGTEPVENRRARQRNAIGGCFGDDCRRIGRGDRVDVAHGYSLRRHSMFRGGHAPGSVTPAPDQPASYRTMATIAAFS